MISFIYKWLKKYVFLTLAWILVREDKPIAPWPGRTQPFDLLPIVVLRPAVLIVEALQVLVHEQHVREHALLLYSSEQ
jgi:hypothetical protein